MKCVLRTLGQLQLGFEVLALGEVFSVGMGAVAKRSFFYQFQSETVLSYNTGYPMGASSERTVLCPHYLREWILFVFSLSLVAIHVCET